MNEHFVPSTADMPPEFSDPEEDAEQHDPRDEEQPGLLGMTSTKLRDQWADWRCADGAGRFANPRFFGKRIGGVPDVAVDAFAALETALKATGYEPSSRWAYNCRKIKGTGRYSLHSYGIAVDIDPKQNKYTSGDPYAGKLQPVHVEAVRAIKNVRGRAIWSWGGDWKKPDRMHFQLDRGPGDLEVDWATVAGAGDVPAAAQAEPAPPARDRRAEPPRPEPVTGGEENVLRPGSRGKAVTYFQERVLVWNENALPQHGADGDYGDETADWVRRFQTDVGIQPTGNIDGVTASLLRGLTE